MFERGDPITLSLLTLRQLTSHRPLQDRPDHLIPDLRSLREPRREELLDLLETVAVGGEVAEADALAPALRVVALLSFFFLLIAIYLFAGISPGWAGGKSLQTRYAFFFSSSSCWLRPFFGEEGFFFKIVRSAGKEK